MLQCRSLLEETSQDRYYARHVVPSKLDPLGRVGQERLDWLCTMFSRRQTVINLTKRTCCHGITTTKFALLACERQCDDCFDDTRTCTLEYAKVLKQCMS
jgi:hypothetical protein